MVGTTRSAMHDTMQFDRYWFAERCPDEDACKRIIASCPHAALVVCDCFGFTSMSILPDAGIFGSDDIVAIEQAVLDTTGRSRLIEDNIPTSMEVHTREGHPLRWLHGPFKDPYLVV
jgi:hypothetical protein